MTGGATWTLAEAAQVLDPPITEQRLRHLVTALRVQPAGTRRQHARGRPTDTYHAADLMRLHAAITLWLLADPDVYHA